MYPVAPTVPTQTRTRALNDTLQPLFEKRNGIPASPTTMRKSQLKPRRHKTPEILMLSKTGLNNDPGKVTNGQLTVNR